MMLADEDLIQLLPDLGIGVHAGAPAFDPNVQVQACSIDLRLDSVFWTLRGGSKRIDLGTSSPYERAPTHLWEQRELSPGDFIDLAPGQLVLAQTLESFTMPSRYAGKIEGRSSFARLGLLVHLQSDFVNPGWSGHKGLQLFNASNATLRIYPHLPVCQLFLLELTGEPKRLYGHRELQSKYASGTGSPSYWWKDSRIADLETQLHSTNLALAKQHALLRKLGPLEADTIDRFRDFLKKISFGDLESTEALFDRFLKLEKRKFWVQQVLRKAPLTLAVPTLFFALARAYQGECYPNASAWCIAPTAIAILLFVLAAVAHFLIPPRSYLNKEGANFDGT